MILALADANIAKLSCARKVFAILVEGDGHDTVSAVECFFDTVTMVDINIDVENTVVEPEKLDDAENDICKVSEMSSNRYSRLTVDVAEAAGFTLLSMVETTSPIDSDIALLAVESCGALHASASGNTTEFEEPIEDRTIISYVEFALLFRECFHVVWRHSL